MFHNKKGFTLIEIIVSIGLMSVVLLLVGSIIISTTGFLSKTTQSDLDKRTIDSVIDFVRTEIKYASDVRVVNQAPTSTNEQDEWHNMYVKDNVLYRDGKQVFTKGFYSDKQLELSAKCNYESNQRIDISYSLSDKGKVNYSSRDTVMLLNLTVGDEIKSQGLYTQESKSLSVDSSGVGYRIYYNKYLSSSAGTSDDSCSTKKLKTVGDEVCDMSKEVSIPDPKNGNKPADSTNNKGNWLENRDYNGQEYWGTKYYFKGDFVVHNGAIWRACFQNIDMTVEPGVGVSRWKKIQELYDSKSYYQRGDVIKYNNAYYRCLAEGSPYPPSNTVAWEKVVPNANGDAWVKSN